MYVFREAFNNNKTKTLNPLACSYLIRMQIQKSKISGSVLVARYRGCVTEINSWRAEETRWTTMFNRRNLLLSVLFPKVCLTNL